MQIDRFLEQKRDGNELNSQDIEEFVNGVTAGEVTRAQAAAFLAFVFCRGMTDNETVALTSAMAGSGYRLSWPQDSALGSLSDKHSTGGVGDKVSLILAPLWATLGARVPMISGRGLGHTGGTLDKLEAIDGFRTNLEPDRLDQILSDVGCFISGQTGELAPADRIFYALRNEICTVPCVPLIVGSILSKKLAAGIRHLVMDVKWGSGAFMKTESDAAELAAALTSVGTGAGLTVRAVISDMNQPLGRMVGNRLEVEESIRCLQGDGPVDLHNLVCDLIGDPKADKVLRSGAAFETFERMVHAQGGALDRLLGTDVEEFVITSPNTGRIVQVDAYNVGVAALRLGGGRTRADQKIHPGVGVAVERKIGDFVTKGEPIFRLYHSQSHGLETAKELLSAALIIQLD